MRWSCLRAAIAAEDLAQPQRERREAGQAEDAARGGRLATRIEVLERFLSQVPDAAAVVATTGKCGRELFTLADRAQHLYQVGSMGGASAMGLGIALNTRRPVVVLDGDGAALMKLGNLATIGAESPENLLHIVLDNGVHDSTGGQATVSSGVDFARAACALGYRRAIAVDELDDFDVALNRAFAEPGPSLLHVRIRPGSRSPLGRPTVAPSEVARRFKGFLSEPPPRA